MRFRVLGLNDDFNHASCVHVAGIPADAGSAQSVRAAVTGFGASFDCVRPRGGSVNGPIRLGAVAVLLCSLACVQLLLKLREAKPVTLLLKLLVYGGTQQE